METQVKGITLKWDSEGNAELCLSLSQSNLPRLKQQTTEVKQRLEWGKIFDCEITEHKEKRSQNANAYMWKLLEKLAIKLNTSKDSLYANMLIRYGVFDTVSMKKEASEQFMKLMRSPCEVLGESKLNGQEFVHIRVCYGSSGYDKGQMKRLLDGIINECNDLNIETKIPKEIEEIMSLWEVKECNI